MIIRILSIIFLLINISHAREYKILAIIGNEIITNYDLEQRIKIISLTSGRSFTGQTLAALESQLLEVLVTEKLYLIEAKKYNLLPGLREVNKSYNDLIEQNKYETIKFENMIKEYGIDNNSIKIQIESELAWQNIILQKIRPNIKINDFEIIDYINEHNNLTDYEYLLKTLEFSIDENSNIKELEHIIHKIYDEVKKNKNSFTQIIKDFSVLNANIEQPIWKKISELDEVVKKNILSLKKNELSKPIKSDNKYYLILLEDVREIKGTDDNIRDEVFKKLFLSKLDAAAESYISDIKRATFIEYK